MKDGGDTTRGTYASNKPQQHETPLHQQEQHDESFVTNNYSASKPRLTLLVLHIYILVHATTDDPIRIEPKNHVQLALSIIQHARTEVCLLY